MTFQMTDDVIERVFFKDGSLRDIYVQACKLNDWQKIYDWIRTSSGDYFKYHKKKISIRRDFMKRLITGVILFLIFGFSYFLTSWNASYLMVEDNWKSKLTFTPKSITNPKDIYEIDKFIYAYEVQPLLSIVCFLSLIALITFLVIQLYKIVKRNNRVNFV